MNSPPLSSSKKCPHCQQWSIWQQSPYDHCEHCGELLDPRAQQSAVDREQASRQKMPAAFLVEIKPEDGALVRFLKTVIRGGQLFFAAILAFIVWLVTVIAG
jgi:predicted amidophosphoribosyltransferase